MQDQFTGHAGTFYTDPLTGERVTAEQWEASQAAKNQPAAKEKTSAKADKQAGE
jgi:hypothetical protein